MLDQFVRDSETIIKRLKNSLNSEELEITVIYRDVHALKGASGFAGLLLMEEICHKLETVLTDIRDGNRSLDDDVIKLFKYTYNYFYENLETWKDSGKELESVGLLSHFDQLQQHSEPLSIEVVEEGKGDNNNFFTEFEETLLTEAMYRGELFYRVICHIDQDEEMKYPRLFLVINNLEKLTNVVKVYPPMADINKNRAKEITLYLTSDKGKSYIYGGLNFDRIREVELQRLNYSSFINHSSNRDNPQEVSLYGSHIDVETSRIEELLNYSQDLYNKLLMDELVIPEKKEEVGSLLNGMKDSLSALTSISSSSAFEFLSIYTQKIANSLGKDVEFYIAGEPLFLDRQVAESLKEVLMQLVKNAVDHGIESPDERALTGKRSTARIILAFNKVKKSIVVTIKDDGRGVNRAEILKKGVEENYIEGDEKLSLLSLLARPGFTTSKDVNYYSGRGVGLDLVVDRVVNRMDGKIKVENKSGSGLTFHILIPPASTVKKFTLFKYRSSKFAFSMVNVVEKLSIDRNAVEFGDNSTLVYRYNDEVYPIFTPWGRLSSSKDEIEEGYGFILRYLGTKAFFPVDEFLLEKEFFSSTITLIESTTPSHKRIKTAEKLEDFTLILPSIINV